MLSIQKLLNVMIALCVAGVMSAHAADQEPIADTSDGEREIILTVLVGDREHAFSSPELLEIDKTEIRTSTDWTDGVLTFTGPLVRDVIAAVMQTTELPEDGSALAIAINEYVVEIPITDFSRYDVIFALEMEGERLTLRDKGPIWIVYPRDDHPQLVDPTVNARWVWQLERLELQ